MLDDAKSIIREEVHKIPGYKKHTAESIMIQCPFHNDKSPSCGIYMAEGMQIPLGHFNCLGCGAKGHWNELAEKLGLQKIAKWQHSSTGDPNDLSNLIGKLEEEMLGEQSLRSLVKSIGDNPILEWAEDTEWRDYSGKLIKDAGGYFMFDNYMDENSLVCFFPISVEGVYYGGVKAYLEKQLGMLSYIATKGNWTKKYGLFPFDLTQKLIDKWDLDYVVLVEGPRDALRLLCEGIPALAVLGSQNISESKIDIVLNLGIKTIYSLPDNDKAGDKMRKTLRGICDDLDVEYKGIKLPKPKYKGKLVKIDPDNCPADTMKDLKTALKTKHGLAKRKKGWKRKKGAATVADLKAKMKKKKR